MFDETEDLRVKIVEWARARNIIYGASLHAQFLKLVEEFGELSEALDFGDTSLIEDGVGDCFVVYTILAEQMDVSGNFADVVADAQLTGGEGSADALPLHFLGVLASAVARQDHKKALIAMRVGLEWLVYIANSDATCENTDLQRCVARAYDEIKDRKGIMFSGVFVKDSDPRYADMLQRHRESMTGAL